MLFMSKGFRHINQKIIYFSFLPIKKLSNTIIVSPTSMSFSTRWLPRDGAPPITST
eukprot:c6912_g1_i1 orf=86-253(+)